MCAVFKIEGKILRPGREVDAIAASGPVGRIWAGFARSEILHWWIQRGGELLDIPATEFAERSEQTGELVWERVPEGMVIRGLLDRQTPHELIKIVTRASTPDELAKFQHARMPVLENPLHTPSTPRPAPVAIVPPRKKPPAMVQGTLFDL